MKVLSGTLLFLSMNTITYGQKEISQWYFGKMTGIDLSGTNPQQINTSSMTTGFGCSSMADKNGTLLFYTNGDVVWNASNNIMANGLAIGGNSVSFQSALAVKWTQSRYYIFTTPGFGNGAFGYSLVDMSLASGMGSVTTKNFTLMADGTDRLTGTTHCNGLDNWVVTQKIGSNQFYVYKVDAAGVNAAPVISSAGPVNTTQNVFGFMKLSPQGHKLVVGYTAATSTIMIFNFDNSTGIISSPFTLYTTTNNAISAGEFSADGSKIYVCLSGGANNAILQFDLCAGSPTAIAASVYTVTAGPNDDYRGIQLAPDGKIIASIIDSQTLSSIKSPNLYGAACNFQSNSIALATGTSQYGLPNFVSSYFRPKPSISLATNTCGSVSFTTQTAQNCNATSFSVTSYEWTFGEPALGAANTSSISNPVHAYRDNGTYTAQVVVHYNCSSDTVKIPVTVTSLPNITLTAKSSICKMDVATISATGASSYSWSTGQTSSSIAVSPTTTASYTVTGTGADGCHATKEVTVTVKPCTGLSSATNPKLDIYPNPSDGVINIRASNKIGLIVVYDQLGQLVRQEYFDGLQGEMDLRTFGKGIYYIKTSGLSWLRLIVQ